MNSSAGAWIEAKPHPLCWGLIPGTPTLLTTLGRKVNPLQDQSNKSSSPNVTTSRMSENLHSHASRPSQEEPHASFHLPTSASEVANQTFAVNSFSEVPLVFLALKKYTIKSLSHRRVLLQKAKFWPILVPLQSLCVCAVLELPLP